MGVLINYLSIDEAKIPCFNRKPTAAVYQDSIAFMLQNREIESFDGEKYLESFLRNDYETLHNCSLRGFSECCVDRKYPIANSKFR